MLGKRTRFVTMMAAALGIPYAWFNENFSAPIRSTWSSLHKSVSSVASGGSSSSTSVPWSPEAPFSFASDTKADVAAAPTMHQLVDVLRFDVTPRWVIDRWPRVSTVHAEQNLEGLRVPLVTGTGLDDIAGSLTYYFDAQRHVRRITLHGHTGDERAVVALGTKHFGLRQEPSLVAGAFLNRWNAVPMNALLISHAPVVRSSTANTRLLIELELNDLRAGYGLSPAFKQRLYAEPIVGSSIK